MKPLVALIGSYLLCTAVCLFKETRLECGWIPFIRILGNEFKDTDEIPTDMNWQSAKEDPQPTTEPMDTSRTRIFGRLVDRAATASSSQPAATRQRTQAPDIADSVIPLEPWYQKTTEASRQEADGSNFWADDSTAVEMRCTCPRAIESWRSLSMTQPHTFSTEESD